MKAVFSLLGTCFLILAFAESSLACSCIIRPLYERFRKSEAMYVGRISDRVNVSNSDIQNFRDGMLVFEVTKKLKGVSKKFVAINLDSDEIGKAGMCQLSSNLTMPKNT